MFIETEFQEEHFFLCTHNWEPIFVINYSEIRAGTARDALQLRVLIIYPLAQQWPSPPFILERVPAASSFLLQYRTVAFGLIPLILERRFVLHFPLSLTLDSEVTENCQDVLWRRI